MIFTRREPLMKIDSKIYIINLLFLLPSQETFWTFSFFVLLMTWAWIDTNLLMPPFFPLSSFGKKIQPSITASLEQRDYVIKELVETEANYLDVLDALKYKFMQPMEKLLRDEIQVIFPRMKVNTNFHEELQKVNEYWKPSVDF